MFDRNRGCGEAMHGGGPDSNSWQTLQGTASKPLGIG